MAEYNHLCVCGHGKDVHEYAMKPHCAILVHTKTQLVGHRCPCSAFKQDNLKYLEQKFKERFHGTYTGRSDCKTRRNDLRY